MKYLHSISALGLIGAAFVFASCEPIASVEPAAEQPSFVRAEMINGQEFSCHFNEPFKTFSFKNNRVQLTQPGETAEPETLVYEIDSIDVDGMKNTVNLDDGLSLEISDQSPNICYDDMAGFPFHYFVKLLDAGPNGGENQTMTPLQGCCKRVDVQVE